LRGDRPGSPPRQPFNREENPMVTKKTKAARAKFARHARSKSKNTKVGRAAAKRGKGTKRK
jgi:hypothetical protein